MTKKWLIAILGAAAMAVSAGAFAQATLSGAYVGLDIGQADFGPEDDTAFKIYGGYKFHPNVAAELGYSMLLDKGGVEVTALELVAVGFFPLVDRLSALGKLGFARLEASPGGSETEFTFGIGLQYDISTALGARLQWQRYTTDPDDVDLFTIGVLFKF